RAVVRAVLPAQRRLKKTRSGRCEWWAAGSRKGAGQRWAITLAGSARRGAAGPGGDPVEAGRGQPGLAIPCRYLVVCRCKRVVMRYTRNGTREQDAARRRVPAWQANGAGGAGAGAPGRPRGPVAGEDPAGQRA